MNNYLKDSLFTYQGLINIKDSVPICPTGEGWENALLNLANFPTNYSFYEIETEGVICSFTTTIAPDKRKEGIIKDYMYEMAFIPSDLIELHKRGYIEGLQLMTEYDWRMESYEIHKKYYAVSIEEDGTLILALETKDPKYLPPKIPKPNFEKYVSEVVGCHLEEVNDSDVLEEFNEIIANDYEYYRRFIKYPKGFKLSGTGKKKVFELTQDFQIPTRINELIQPLLKINYHDTTIREVALLIETCISNFHRNRQDINFSRLYGQELIEEHIKECVKANKGNYNAGLKIYRQELRTLNRFVRNPFMHGFKNVDKEYCNRLLFRQCYVFGLMEQAFNKLLE